MKILANPFRFALFALALPAALTFSSCDDDDTEAPQQGKVLISHAAATSGVRVKALVNDREVSQLNYGQTSSYINVNTGAATLKVNVASSNQTILSPALTIEKDKAYSAFAYSPTSALGSAAALVVPDDLTAPPAGKAKIRLVHLGVDAPTPVSLSSPSPTVGTTDIVANVAFGTASPFVELNPGPYNLAISTGSGIGGVVRLSVGDGTGNSPNTTRNYVAGKIYTVLVRGISSPSISQEFQLKAVVIENN